MTGRGSDKRKNGTSRFISLILRHKPETIGISLDEHGWADVRELIEGVNRTVAQVCSHIKWGQTVLDQPEGRTRRSRVTPRLPQSGRKSYRKFLDFIGDAANSGTIICGHVVAFDLSFLCRRMDDLGLTGHFRFIDTRQLAVRIAELEHHSLGAVAQHFGIPHEMAHHAREDALTSGRILWRILGR